MKEFIAACVQIAVTPNDVQANVDKGIVWLEKAVSEYEADLVVFPETVTTSFVTGLETEALWDLVDEAPGRITRDIQAAAKSLGVHVVWPSYRRGPERGVIYNSAILIGPDGGIIGIYDKTHPFPLERRDCGGWVTVGNRADVFETALGSIGMIIGYDGVTQFFPGVVLGLFWKRATKGAILSGIITGISVVVVLIYTGHDPFLGMNAGFVGLVLNSIITLAVCFSVKPNSLNRQQAENV